MNGNFPSKHNYKLLKSEPYLCVASVLATILDSEDIRINFNTLADHFNYSFPHTFKPKIKLSNYSYSVTEIDWGVKLNKSSINDLFVHFSIPLIEKYIPINTLNEWDFYDIIKANLTNHIVIGYDYSFLYHNEEKKIGHVSLIGGLYDENQIKILNPGPLNYGERIFETFLVYQAIRLKKDGLWIISRI